MFRLKLRSLSSLLLILCFTNSYAGNLVPQMVGNVLIMVEDSVNPVAAMDQFRVDSNVSTNLAILDNDSILSVSDVLIVQSANSSASWDAVNQVIAYTPNQDFRGMDYFTYQLVDSTGEVSNPATVEVEAVIGKAAKPTLTPLNDTTNHLVWLESGQNSVTVTITSSPGAKIMMELLDRNTLEVTPDVEYTGPFTLYTNTRVVAWAYGPGYDRSDSFFANYLFCEDGSTQAWCGYAPPAPVQNGFGWDNTNIKVGQSATLSWDFANVTSCVEETSTESQLHTRPSNGQIQYTFNQAGTVQSKWYCKDSNGNHVYPANGEFLYANLTVEKLSAPAYLNARRGYETDSVLLDWGTASLASGYTIQTKLINASYWSTLQNCSAQLTNHCIRWISSTKAEVMGVTAPSNNKYRVMACTATTCNNTGSWSSEESVLVPSNGMVAVDDSATVEQDSSSNSIPVLSNDVNPFPTTPNVVILTQPANGLVVKSGSNILYTPNAGFSGTDTAEYSFTDMNGNISTIGVVNFTVNVNNQLPAISPIVDQSKDEDSGGVTIGFTVSDAETAAAELVPSGTSSNQALVADSDISFGGSGSNRTITVSPKANKHGTTTITVTVSDGTGTTDEVFTLNVAPVNDLPTGSVTISGSVQVAETLSVSNDLADIDGLGIVSYQWYKDDVVINGATGTSYLIAAEDIGSQLSVSASYVDGDGTSESVMSTKTASVGSAVAQVTISNLAVAPSMVKVGSVLTVSFDYTDATKCYDTDTPTFVYFEGTEASGSYSGDSKLLYSLGANTLSVTCENSGTHAISTEPYTAEKVPAPGSLLIQNQ